MKFGFRFGIEIKYFGLVRVRIKNWKFGLVRFRYNLNMFGSVSVQYQKSGFVTTLIKTYTRVAYLVIIKIRFNGEGRT